MNPTEQKTHQTALRDLENATSDRMDSLETLCHQIFEAARDGINEERTHRLKLANEQRGYVDNEDRQIRQCCQERWNETSATTKRLGDRISELRDRGFWSRLNWLLSGR